MKTNTLLTILVFLLGICGSMAQTRIITGHVTSAEDKSPIPGVTILIKGTSAGTVTNADGKYSLTVPGKLSTLVFSCIGMRTEEVVAGELTVINIVLQPAATTMKEVVVTALGIPRDKKSLGYATQEVNGDVIQKIKTGNFVNLLAGEVAGAQIRTNTNIGGSTNVLLRGIKSLEGNNQALFVIDGVPVSNENTNTLDQQTAGEGYDYGNAASDINPDDVESINVLKGAAATALYGSRAANGVIMITTKKGAVGGDGEGLKRLHVTLNSGIKVGFVDKSTFPVYQQEYGAGYGPYYEGPGSFWYMRDILGTGQLQQCVVTSEDASYGAPFDPNLMVYQWDAFDPSSPNYHKATPWVAAKNGPVTFFKNPVTYMNSVSIDNSFKTGNVRLSYTNFSQDGLLPNSQMTKNNVLLNGTWNLSDRLTAAGSANYIATKTRGRNETGYGTSSILSMRQWMQTNVDIQEQKAAYLQTKRNMTWNWADPTDLQPIFWDNYYWTRYENYETDGRNRFIGYLSLKYKVANWFDIFGRISVDMYDELQEERKAMGSVPGQFGIGYGADGSLGRNYQPSGYLRRDITFSEYNYDLMANFNKDFLRNFNIRGVLGMNIRRTNQNRVVQATSGGLIAPEIYSLQNSAGTLPLPNELASTIGVDGIYGSASLGYKSLVYLDLTLRRDQSSTLPVNNSAYFYPSIAGSFVFSNLLKEAGWLSFGKVRLNYASVGNAAPFDQVTDTYYFATPFGSPITFIPEVKKNPDLKPEMTHSLEGGLEMHFLGKRLGFDMALYKTNSVDQIVPLRVSVATGFFYKVVNAGNIENKGIEFSLNAIPIQTTSFTWSVTLNWAKNRNKVVALTEGVDNMQLGSFQGGVSLNARVGQPYGVLEGTDYIYLNGQKVVDPQTGYYLVTNKSDNVIGNVNPDWTGGMRNTFSYRNWALSFMVDVSKGGDVFSLDMAYGLATGLYKETAYINDLGNPVRNPIVCNIPGDPASGYARSSGGFINPGVNPDGAQNQTRTAADEYGAFGYLRNPNKTFVYDATYVKLREIALSYTFPLSLLKKTFISGITLSAVASNVWIIFKNLPYADPESGLGSGNLQGYSTSSLPSTRDFGFNLKLSF
ncbi:MAG: SusC/RagA family TonB-linked outer membrane protein [Bacteroidota bacterium]